jgi:hypothetical protein
MKKTEKDFYLAKILYPTDEWFEYKFNSKPDPIFVKFIYDILNDNRSGRDFIISYKYVEVFLNRRKSSKFVKDICKALNTTTTEYTMPHNNGWEKVPGIARKINIGREKADQLMNEWYRNLNMQQFNKVKVELSPALEDSLLENTSSKEMKNIIMYLNYITRKHEFDWSLIDDNSEETLLCKKNHITGLLYKEKNRRPVAIGHSLQNMKTELRRKLTPRSQNYYELDLESAHFSIIARLLDVILPRNYRKELAELISVPEKCIKEFLIRFIYNAGYEKLSLCLIDNVEEMKNVIDDCNFSSSINYYDYYNDKYNILNKYNTLMNVKYINEIKDKIKDYEFNIDAFGAMVEGDKISRISQVLCSWEKKLLYPIYEAADGRYDNDITIVLDQADGLTVKIDNPGKVSINDVISTALDQIDELGIITTITIKN